MRLGRTLSARIRRPSPALVVAVIALVIALAGTAVAVTDLHRNEVTSKVIAPGAVKASDLHDRAVLPSKLLISPEAKGAGLPSTALVAGAEPKTLEKLEFQVGHFGSGFQERLLFVGAVQVTNSNPGGGVARVTVQGLLNGNPVSGDAFVNDVPSGATETIPITFTARVGSGAKSSWQLAASSTGAGATVDGGQFSAGAFADAPCKTC